MEKNLKLKALLASKDIKHKKLAEVAGVTGYAISQIVNGKSLPSLRTAQRIAEFLEVDINELWPLPKKEDGDGSP